MTNDQQEKILHVSNGEAIKEARETGSYKCESLESEGFIHCCKQQQLAGVLERYYAGVSDLQLLEIDPAKLDAKLVYENTMGGDELFPHVYGEINMSAVIGVTQI